MVKQNRKKHVCALLCIFALTFAIIGAISIPTSAESQGKLLYAGGIPFGVKFYSKGIVVAGFCYIKDTVGDEQSPALDAGLMKNDVILSLDGKAPESCEEFLRIINESKGKALNVVYLRDEKKATTTLSPVYSENEGRYKCGMYIRQGGAGIGTITYIDPDDLSFGGLGHGISDADTGKLLEITHGITMNVSINGIIKGRSGAPGELKGSFATGKTGIVHSNRICGVFGVLSSIPQGIELKKYPIASRNEVKEGKAYMLCSLDGGAPERYEIEISSIKRDCASDDNKCFTVKVKDQRLIDRAGGIVQGMSGSTIIQGSRIVGAVTHVMISDPTVGYGIFIENMLNNSQR